MLQFWMAYSMWQCPLRDVFLSASQSWLSRIDTFLVLSPEIYIISLSVTAISNTDVWMAYWCAVTNYNCTSFCPPWCAQCPPPPNWRGTAEKWGHSKKIKSCPSTFNLLPAPLYLRGQNSNSLQLLVTIKVARYRNGLLLNIAQWCSHSSSVRRNMSLVESVREHKTEKVGEFHWSVELWERAWHLSTSVKKIVKTPHERFIQT